MTLRLEKRACLVFHAESSPALPVGHENGVGPGESFEGSDADGVPGLECASVPTSCTGPGAAWPGDLFVFSELDKCSDSLDLRIGHQFRSLATHKSGPKPSTLKSAPSRRKLKSLGSHDSFVSRTLGPTWGQRLCGTVALCKLPSDS